MKSTNSILALCSSVFCILLTGCVPNYQAQNGPAPPPVQPTYQQAPAQYSEAPPPRYSEAPPRYDEAPPLVQLAEHNGFLTGRTDGARDSSRGFEAGPQRTRAYHDTPGFNPRLGPFQQYQNAFRNAYLRGYDQGFFHR